MLLQHLSRQTAYRGGCLHDSLQAAHLPSSGRPLTLRFLLITALAMLGNPLGLPNHLRCLWLSNV